MACLCVRACVRRVCACVLIVRVLCSLLTPLKDDEDEVESASARDAKTAAKAKKTEKFPTEGDRSMDALEAQVRLTLPICRLSHTIC